MRIFTTILSVLLLVNVSAQSSGTDLKIRHLTGEFYVFETYNWYKEHRIPANGMYVVTQEGVVLIDSPWDTSQFQPLLDSIWMRHHKPVTMCVATHFHDDRTAGLEYYRRLGINTYTTRKTDELSKAHSMKRAEFLIDGDTTFTAGTIAFEIIHPGEGHTPDNIVIWFPTERILYGGCLIKSIVDNTLGNLGDANVSSYAATVQAVMRKCQKPRFVIPGHNAWGGAGTVRHTLKMAKKTGGKKAEEK